MKYSSHKSVAEMMGKIMARAMPRPDVDFLVPVPLHKGSLREYNQTELIALGMSGVWGIPVKNCLRWRADTANQASSPDRESRELPAGAIETVSDVRQNALLLVDDVCTTGNTLMAASRALMASGAAELSAAVWSRSV
jgi:predicted amidophosphoribosyltransferase